MNNADVLSSVIIFMIIGCLIGYRVVSMRKEDDAAIQKELRRMIDERVISLKNKMEYTNGDRNVLRYASKMKFESVEIVKNSALEFQKELSRLMQKIDDYGFFVEDVLRDDFINRIGLERYSEVVRDWAKKALSAKRLEIIEKENNLCSNVKKAQKELDKLNTNPFFVAPLFSSLKPGDGIAFENYMASIFVRKGYECSSTPVSGDHGVDLIVEKSGIRTAIQCKFYSNGTIGNEDVLKLYAGKDMYNCTKSIMVATVPLSRTAQEVMKRFEDYVEYWGMETIMNEERALSSTMNKVHPEVERASSKLKLALDEMWTFRKQPFEKEMWTKDVLKIIEMRKVA